MLTTLNRVYGLVGLADMLAEMLAEMLADIWEAFLQNGQIRIAWADGDANDRNKQPEVVALVRRFVEFC